MASSAVEEAEASAAKLFNAEVEASLYLHAHRMGLYYRALIDEGIPETVAGNVIIAWQKVTVEAETYERSQRREMDERRRMMQRRG